MSSGKMQWTFLFLALVFATGIAGQPSVVARLDSTDILIGDEVRLGLEISLPPGSEVVRIGIDTLRMVKGLERRRASSLSTLAVSNAAFFEQFFVLSAFDSGFYRLPPIPVDVRTPQGPRRLYSNDLGLMVRSIPISTDTAQLQPIKEIWKEPLKATDLWWIALLLAGIGGMIFLLRWLNRKKMPREEISAPTIQRPAHEIALEQLVALKAAGLPGKGQFKQFQSELTHILKSYISDRFQVNALESTTDEVRDLLQHLGAEASWSEALVRLLRNADWVKFAKGSLPEDAHESAWQTVYDFVLATRETEPADQQEKV